MRLPSARGLRRRRYAVGGSSDRAQPPLYPCLPMRLLRTSPAVALFAVTVACVAAAPTTPGSDTTGSDTTGTVGSGVHASRIAKTSGDAQTGTLSSTLAAPLVVTVTGATGTPVSGAAVTWTVAQGNGALSASSSTTDASGHASVRWTLDGTFLSTSATASIPGSSVTFTALGNGSGDLGGHAVFSASDPWRTDISASPRDALSDSLIAS